MNETEKVMQRFGIVPGGVLTVDQIKAMTLAIKAGQLKVDHFRQVADMTKSFNAVALEAARSFTASIESAGRVKQSALDANVRIVEALERIATSTDDANIKSKVIDALLKLAGMIEKADERNHRYFVGIGLAAASVIVSVILRRPVRIA